MLHKLRLLLIPLAFVALPLNATAKAYENAREVYQLAEQALEQNDNIAYKKWYQQLKTAQYPLLPYLDYQAISKDLSLKNQPAIDAFLAKHQGQYIARRMQATWLIYLAKQKKWQLFKQYDQTAFQSDNFKCWRLSAKAHEPNTEKAVLLQSQKLWLTSGHSLPKSCDVWLEHFKNSSLFSSKAAFTRLQLAFSQNNTHLARYLKNDLNAKDKNLADKILKSTQHKAFWLEQPISGFKDVSSAVYKTVLENLLANDYQNTVAALNAKRLSPLAEHDKIRIQRLSAWYLAKDSGTKALAWLKLQENYLEPKLLEKQLRFSLQDKLWPEFISLYQKAPAALQEKAEWRYWYSHALKAQKHNKLADEILLALAKERHFYGFVAAESLALEPYIFSKKPNKPVVVSNTVKKRLSAAGELYRLGHIRLANREFYFSSRNFNQQQWHEAGILSHSLKWHSQAIRALAKAKAFDAISLRFPLAFKESFNKYGQASSLEPSWLLSMARQESGFLRQAQSHKGAKGVLQLMPQTAKKLKRKYRIKNSETLFNAEHNIQLASLYLKDMLARFDGNYILATAAYNAGPKKVDEWLEQRPIGDNWQHWVANIPYQETRQYVQHIISYSHIYQNQLRPSKLELSLLHTKPNFN